MPDYPLLYSNRRDYASINLGEMNKNACIQDEYGKKHKKRKKILHNIHFRCIIMQRKERKALRRHFLHMPEDAWERQKSDFMVEILNRLEYDC